MARRRDDLLQRALLETDMKYGAQGAALRSLLSELAGGYTRTRRVNASNARGIVAATQEARPEMAQAFDQALATASAARGALGTPAAEPQAQAYTRRVSEQRANALNALTDRATRAQEGQVFANQQARQEYMGGKAKIQGQLADLLRESGQATAARYADLLDEQRKVALEEAKFGETRRHNQAQESVADRRADIAASSAARQAREARRSRSGVKWESNSAHSRAKDEIERARSLIQQQRKRGMKSRAEIIRLLTGGRSSQTVEVDGKKVSLPAIPALGADYVRAAMNLEFDGSLSRQDLKRLHNRRLQLRRLGYDVRPPRPRGPGGAVGLAVNPGRGRTSRRPPVPGLR